MAYNNLLPLLKTRLPWTIPMPVLAAQLAGRTLTLKSILMSSWDALANYRLRYWECCWRYPILS